MWSSNRSGDIKMKPSFKSYLISDTHFRHGNIIPHANRPFKSVEIMDDHLINNWNSTVKQNDIVYVVGDFIWTQGSSQLIKELIKKLNGRIILIMGNHDRKTVSFYLSNGIQFACNKFVGRFINKNVLFIHNPAEATSADIASSEYIIHGHLHGRTPLISTRFGRKFINVSAENVNYTPINLETLLNRLTHNVYK